MRRATVGSGLGRGARRACLVLLLGVAGVAEVASAQAQPARPVVSAASGPCGSSGVLSSTQTANTCAYSSAGTEDTFAVPSGVTSLDVTAIGASGANAAAPVGETGGFGGPGAQVTNTGLLLPSGVSQLWVDVGAPGSDECSGAWPDGGGSGCGNGAEGGGGGGSSALSVAPRTSASLTADPSTDSRLLVAGGGGGGGESVDGTEAGDDMVAGAGNGGGFNGNQVVATDGGIGAGGGAGGPGLPGAGGGSQGGGSGSASSGGAGDPTDSNFSDAGGGGGWVGGGGASEQQGGAGGSSYSGAGGTGAAIGIAPASGSPEVSVGWPAVAPASVSVSVAPDASGDGGYTVTAQALDGNGNLESSYDDASPSWSDTNGALPAGVSPSAFLDGVSTTTEVKFSATDRDTVSITTRGMAGTSSAFTVAGPLSKFVVLVGSPVTAGHAVALRVIAEDANGNTVATYSGRNATWSDTVGEKQAQALTFSDGISRNAIVLPTAARQDRIEVSADSSNVTGESRAFTVYGAAPTQFEVVFPRLLAVNHPAALTVVARDSAGNRLVAYSGQKATFSDTKGVFSGVALDFSQGEATTSLQWSSPVRQDQITVRDDADSSVNGKSALFSVAGPVSQLVIHFQGPVHAGKPFAVTVSGEDAVGNVISGYAPSDATISDRSGQVSKQALKAFKGGVSANNSVTIAHQVPGGDQLTATDAAGGISGTSSSFYVWPAASAKRARRAATR